MSGCIVAAVGVSQSLALPGPKWDSPDFAAIAASAESRSLYIKGIFVHSSDAQDYITAAVPSGSAQEACGHARTRIFKFLFNPFQSLLKMLHTVQNKRFDSENALLNSAWNAEDMVSSVF